MLEALRLASRWQGIYQRLSGLLDNIVQQSGVAPNSTNLTTIIHALLNHYMGDDEMTGILNRCQVLVDQLEGLATDIDRLGGDVFRELDPSVTESQRKTLDGIFEQIGDNLAQE